jgi:hypothetical protein
MRRMLTINEMYNKLKVYFADKTNTGTEAIAGDLLFQKNAVAFSPSKFVVKELGTVQLSDLLSAYIPASTKYNGLYHFNYGSGEQGFMFITFSVDLSSIRATAVIPSSPGQIITSSQPYSSAIFQNLIYGTYLSNTDAYFSDVESINANLGGTPQKARENSTLHIRGTFTPTATIAAGTKLFATGQTLSAKMTHGSAINTGSTGSETFVGISIQTNGDVYCLGALTAGVTYNIAVTATI